MYGVMWLINIRISTFFYGGRQLKLK